MEPTTQNTQQQEPNNDPYQALIDAPEATWQDTLPREGRQQLQADQAVNPVVIHAPQPGIAEAAPSALHLVEAAEQVTTSSQDGPELPPAA